MSSEATYQARASSKLAASQAIQAITLTRNTSGQYQHDVAEKAIEAILRHLLASFNASQSGRGMSALAESTTNSLTSIKSTDSVTTDSILAAATTEAIAAAGKPDAIQTKYTRSEARDEADAQNYSIQATIGTKEGVAEGITQLVGSAITDSVLKNVDGSPKTVDEYTIALLLQAIRDGSIRPEHQDVLDLGIAVLSFRFDWRKKIPANLEQLKVTIERGKAFGLNLDVTFLVRVLLSNLHEAVQHDWGRDLFESHQKLRKRYPYSTVHTTATLQAIMTELTPADNTRDPSKAPAPSTASAYAAMAAGEGGTHGMNPNANDSLTILSNFMQDSDFEESAYAAHDSDSSIETKKSTKSAKSNKSSRRSTSNGRGRRGNSRDRDDSKPAVTDIWQNNPCKHCKKYKRRNQHPDYPANKCFWNKPVSMWRPGWVCEEMEIKYKPRHLFKQAEDSE